MNENIIVPPPPSTLSSQIETGAGGRPDSNNRKNSDKGVYCWFFLQLYYIFLRFKRVETFIGGGCNFLLFFFLGGGGGGGVVQILISIETYITCDFSGGGGVRTTYPSLDSRMGKK